MLSKTLLIVLLVYLSSNFSCGQRDKHFFRKDYTYLETVEGFYKFHLNKGTWEKAKRECTLEKASLFYPENVDEVQAVISFWNKTKPSTKSVYVGMSNFFTSGLFETTDGKTISEVYKNWGPGEPTEETSQNTYLVMDQQGYLDDINKGSNKDKPRPFICKKSLQSVEWNYNCNMSNLDYTINETLNKCYKLHTAPLNWLDAYFMCRSEESYLAVIDTPMEAEYFSTLAESSSNLGPRGQEIYQRGIYHLGFHNNDEGWTTIKGNHLNDTRDWWGNYIPDAEDRKKCGSMFYTGRLNNIHCDTKSFFICEHDINEENKE